jgi:hypothetical protein
VFTQANGENRKYLALAFGAALVAAIATKLGEWGVERLRKAVKDPSTTPPETKTPPTPF